jgi:hypothetical protein
MLTSSLGLRFLFNERHKQSEGVPYFCYIAGDDQRCGIIDVQLADNVFQRGAPDLMTEADAPFPGHLI